MFTPYQVENPLNFEPLNPVVTTSSAPDNYFSFDIDRKIIYIHIQCFC